jgi:hypothetical protein
MTTYATQGPPHAGAVITLATPGGTTGDLAPTGQGIAVLVVTGGTGTTVTLPVTPTYDGLGVTSRTLAVPASSTALIPLPDSVYGVGTTAVNYNSTATVTVASVRIP